MMKIQEVAEVFALHHGVFLVQLLYADQSAYDMGHTVAILSPYLLVGQVFVGLARVEDDGHHAVASQPGLLDGDLCGLQSEEDGVEPEDVALDEVCWMSSACST